MRRQSIGSKLSRVVVLTLTIVLLLSVLTPAASAWRTALSSNPFNDVRTHHWHHDYVSWAWINGVTTGTSSTTFGPDSNVTRAQFATFIHRVAGRPHASPSAFADSGTIPNFATIAVGWASSTGVSTGFLNDNTYRPNINITREQIATMLHRYAENIGADTTSPTQALDAFPDRARVSGWATAAMRWAVHHGIITGLNGNLAPQSNATRAQTVTMLKRVVDTFGIDAVNLPYLRDIPGAPHSLITLPNRRATDEERQTWIDEYSTNGGPTDVELEVIRLVNIERVNYGLEPVSMDITLMQAARYFAQQAYDLRGLYTGTHNFGPYANDPNAGHGASANVAAAFGARLRWNGGNWFSGGTLSAEFLVNGWMNSPGHRAYILSPEHRFMGAGQFPGGISYMYLSDQASLTGPLPPAPSMTAFADEIFQLTNIERERAGLPPFLKTSNLSQAAMVRANELITNLSCDRPDGTPFSTILDEHGIIYTQAGTNTSWGHGDRTSSEVVQMWMHDPGHRAGILYPDYTHLGVGVAIHNNILYFVQIFIHMH